MIVSVVQKFLCRRYAPLLTPYSEGYLEAPTRARIARHLASCPNCRAELNAVSSIAALLRANPPVAAKPATDLWSKLQAQIIAEAPQPLSTPLSPIQRPRLVWGIFGRAFAAAGPVVGIGVACTLILLQKGLEWNPPVRITPEAAATTPKPSVPDVSAALTIALQPISKAPPSPALKPRPSQVTLARQEITPRFAKTKIQPEKRPSRPLQVADATPADRPSPIQVVIRHSPPVIAAGVYPASHDVLAASADAQPLGLPMEPQKAANLLSDQEGNKDMGETDRNTFFGYKDTQDEKEMVALEVSARVPLRQVAWVPDSEMEARAVPAAASAADDLMHERRRQTLFSYAR